MQTANPDLHSFAAERPNGHPVAGVLRADGDRCRLCGARARGLSPDRDLYPDWEGRVCHDARPSCCPGLRDEAAALEAG